MGGLSRFMADGGGEFAFVIGLAGTLVCLALLTRRSED